MRRMRAANKFIAITMAFILALACSIQGAALTITDWNVNTDVYNTTTIDGVNNGYITCTSGTIAYTHSDQNGTWDNYTNNHNGSNPTADDILKETGTITFTSSDWTYVKRVYDAQGINYTETTTTSSGNFNLQDILNKSAGEANIVTVTFTAGTYNLYGPFRPYSYCTLKRSGSGTVLLKKMNSKAFFINTDDDTASLTAYNGSYGQHYENLSFDANNNTLPASFIKSTHAKYYSITGCTFQNGIVSHCVEWTGMSTSTIDGCTFQNIRTASDGTYLTYSNMASVMGSNYDYEVVQIEGDSNVISVSVSEQWGYDITVGQIGFAAAQACHDNTISTDITVKNSTFYNILRGVGHHWKGGGVYQTNVTLTNNTFDTVLHHAIYLQGYKNVSITNNYFYAISAPAIGGNRIHLKTCVNSSGTAYGSSMVTTLAGTNYYKNSAGNWVLLTNNTTDQRIVVES